MSSSEAPWKKTYSPPMAGHSFSEQTHLNRNSSWNPSSKPTSAKTDDHKRDRDRRPSPTRRSRDRSRRIVDISTKSTTTTQVTTIPPSAEPRSLVVNELPSVTLPKVDDVDETRPSSSALDVEENFSDFSDDVDEILNRDLQVCLIT